MIGYMKLTNMHSNADINDEHKFDLIGETHGFLAVIPFKEVRKLARTKTAKQMSNITRMACQKVMETLSNNMNE